MVVSRYSRLGLGVIYLFLATPVARAALEATMGRHMLVQIPLLAAAGVIAARWLPERRKDSLLAACGGALPCVVVALFAASYWMLPRALDAALANPWPRWPNSSVCPHSSAYLWRSLGSDSR